MLVFINYFIILVLGLRCIRSLYFCMHIAICIKHNIHRGFRNKGRVEDWILLGCYFVSTCK